MTKTLKHAAIAALLAGSVFGTSAYAGTGFSALEGVAPEAMSAAEMDAVRGQITIEQLVAAVNASTRLSAAQKAQIVGFINANAAKITNLLNLLKLYGVKL